MTVRIFPAILVILMLVFFGADYFLMIASNEKFGRTEIQFRKDLNEYLSKSFIGLVGPDTEKETCARLYAAFHNELLVLFMLRSSDRGVLCIKSRSANAADLNVKYTVFDKIVSTPDSTVAYRATQKGEYLLVTGTVNDSDAQLQRMADSRNKYMWFYFLKGFVVFAGVLYFGFGWIFKFLGSIQSRSYISSKLQGTVSKFIKFQEVSLLAKASEATFMKLTETENELALVSSSLTKTLISEIRSKQSLLPYSFEAAVLRLDLNNYTKTFLNENPQAMISLIDKFATICDEIINRYGGLIYQFIGDEFVVVFRDDAEKKFSGKAKALACVRDIFATPIVHGDINLTTKASISFDTLTFFKLPFGYFYTGLPLIKSQRMLNEVFDKDSNSLIIDASTGKEATDYGKFSAGEMVSFKGFSNPETVIRLIKFNAFEAQSLDLTSIMPSRTDAGVAYLLNTLPTDVPVSLKFDRIEYLKSFQPSKIDKTVSEAWLNALKYFCEADVSPENAKLLSSFIMTAKPLIPKKDWNSDLSQALFEIPQNKGPRVVANAAEILLQKESIDKVAVRLSQLNSVVPEDYFRLYGNILCADLKESLSKEKLSALLQMLNSVNVKAVTTAIWVAEEIILFHLHSNRASFEAFSKSKEIINRLHAIAEIANNDLSKKAKVVCEKIDNKVA